MTLEFQNQISIQPTDESGGGGGGGTSGVGVGTMLPQEIKFTGLVIEAKGENQ